MSEPGTLLHLQNGSDVRGVAMAEPGGPAVTLDGQAARDIARAFALWIQTGGGKERPRIGVGHDSRLTAEPLKRAVIDGLAAEGAAVFDCGLASTPAMFMGTVFPETAFDGAMMLTASHLPGNRNGMKFFTPKGGLEKQDVTALLGMAADRGPTPEGFAEPCDLMTRYAAYLREKITVGVGTGQRPLSGLHIVVDAGNGAGGFFVSQVLESLGADCTGSQFLEPDGSFPNHQPNPENKEAMASISAATTSSGADLGLIFDTDVDRMSAVLPDGRPVSRNAIIAMMAAILAPDHPGATIVTDSITSDRLTAFLEDKLGLRHHPFKRGYKNVINEAIRLNGEGVPTPLAIETSGHGALQENFFLDDGAYLAVRLVIAAAGAKGRGETFSTLLEGFVPAPCEQELRIPIRGEGFAAYGQAVLEGFREKAETAGLRIVPSHEGVRLSFGEKGWAMLRMSLHDPILPLNAESGSAEGLEEILSTVKALLQSWERLEL